MGASGSTPPPAGNFNQPPSWLMISADIPPDETTARAVASLAFMGMDASSGPDDEARQAQAATPLPPRKEPEVEPQNGTTTTALGARPLTTPTPPEQPYLPERGSSLNSLYTFEQFVEGPSNQFAHRAAQEVAKKLGHYNPLFVYGESGLGKTHLMHAIGHYVNEHSPQLKVICISTEAFVNELIDAIRTNRVPAFKQYYREADVLLVDDVQFLEGKDRAHEEFFNLFNYLHDRGRQIILTSDHPPKFIPTLDDRTRSRLGGSLAVNIQLPDFETRLAILQKRVEAEQVDVTDDAMMYIATHVTDNIRELKGALTTAVTYARHQRTALTQALAEETLRKLIETQHECITPQMILQTTAKMFGLPVEEICGPSRNRHLVHARRVGMYVFRELTDFSYPAIGTVFGDRDDSTVRTGVGKVTELMKERRDTYDQVKALIRKILSEASPFSR